VNFYDEVLIELVTALGAALFVANAFALLRRRSDARRAAQRSVANSRPGSPVRGNKRGHRGDGDLPQAPVARSVTYLVVGFFVMIVGLASLTHHSSS
jgi:hypothetical protein